MKLKLFTTLLLLQAVVVTYGQNIRSNELHLYASMGVKQLNEKMFLFKHNVSPRLATTIGAGSFIQKNKFGVGMEFFYANARNKMKDLQADYSSLSNHVIIGFKLNANENWRLSLQSGVGYTLEHLYVTNEEYQNGDHFNTVVFHKNYFSVPAAVFLQKVNLNGTFFSIKAGYLFPIKGSDWEFRERGNTRHFESGPEGWYVHFNMGGFLKFKPKP